MNEQERERYEGSEQKLPERDVEHSEVRHRNIQRRSRGNRDIRDIERELADTQNDITRTLEAIRDQLSFGSIVDQVVDYSRRGPGEMAGNLGRAIRDNPFPVLLTAIGAASMVASSRSTSQRPHAKESVHEKAERVGGAVGGARERARDLGGRWSERASDAASRVSGAGRSARARTSGLIEVLRDNPLLLAAAGMLAGAALAAGAPTSRVEARMTGRISRDIAQRTKRASEEAANRAKEESRRREHGAEGEEHVPR